MATIVDVSGIELHPCEWIRLFCKACGGMTNLALPERPTADQKFTCPKCSAPCSSGYKGRGRTTHPVPHIEPVTMVLRPRFRTLRAYEFL